MPVFNDFTQAVTIEGFPAFVHDLSIKESSSDRVTAIDFAVERLQTGGQDAAYDSCEIGAIVDVSQAVGGSTQTWEAIVTDVTENRASDYTFKRVQCRSVEFVASSTRFLDFWEATPASQIVLEAWQRHAPNSLDLQGISLAGVDNNPKIIEEYASKFDSLFDLMDEVCNLTGWAWKIRGGVLQFFDPIANAGPPIDQSFRRIEGDTLRLKQSLEGVFNVYRMQAFSYKTISVRRDVEDQDCIGGLIFDPALIKGFEIVGTPTIKEQYWNDEGFEVDQVEVEEGIVRLNKSRFVDVPPAPSSITIDIVVRVLVWVQRLDETSILKYGRRDAPPISDNGGLNVKAATQLLDEMLSFRSTPAADLSLGTIGVGWIPDQVVDVFLDNPEFSAALYVTGVTRTTDGNDLSVQISLTSPYEIVEGEAVEVGARRSRSQVDPAYEIGRRVERLERRSAHPAEVLGISTGIFGVFAGASEASERQGWRSETRIDVTEANFGGSQGWSDSTTTDPALLPNIADGFGWAQSVTIESTIVPGSGLYPTDDITFDPRAPLDPVAVSDATGWGSTTTAASTAEPILSFDGVNDSVSIPNDGSLDALSFTVKARFKATGGQNSGDLLTVYSNQEGDFTTRSVIIWINGGHSSFPNNAIVARTVDSGGNPVTVVADNQDYFDGEFHDVELTSVQGDRLELRVDGVLRATTNADIQPLTGMYTNTIGAENSSPLQRFFEGEISLVEIINNASIGGPTTVAKYDMSGISGSTLPDVSGNNNDGTINGATPGTA